MTAPSTPLRHGRSDGYRLCTWTRGGLTRALVATADDASPPPARSLSLPPAGHTAASHPVLSRPR
ncbi:hypothetical protein [Streptomyces milbemycinicus]|uniref:hypothetical protein n=1 Tax=Streptomyces milbemycinicus TaxID=476552 RepID=UPI0033F23285